MFVFLTLFSKDQDIIVHSHRLIHTYIMGSGSGEGKLHWCVFDGVKIIAATPEALMAEIDSAISNLEYARATALLESCASSSSSSSGTATVTKSKGSDSVSDSDASLAAHPGYDARMADEAYRAGCAALAAGKLDEALHSLNLSLSKCPPDKTSAVAKLQSLISLTTQKLQRSAN